jgi:hypothetical protein
MNGARKQPRKDDRWICSHHAVGVNSKEYCELVRGNSVAALWDWRLVTRNGAARRNFSGGSRSN